MNLDTGVEIADAIDPSPSRGRHADAPRPAR